ncbi:unnamed protein product, partial [Cyprideis torosa]
MADAIYGMLNYPAISTTFIQYGKEEVMQLKWENVALEVHQPYRLKRYRFFDIGNDDHYFNEFENRKIMRKVAEKCYLPTNQLFLELIERYGSALKICYSISGTALDQFIAYAPDVLDSFKRLVDTGQVELLSETYSHSLSALVSPEEFKNQVLKHKLAMEEHFNYSPKAFRNTELIYSNQIGTMVKDLGYNLILTEGAKHVLGWKSPNYLYTNPQDRDLKLLLKNFKLSDDIAFRFSNQSWEAWPLTAEKFVSWLNQVPSEEPTVNLFMDYETFGEHQWKETGIFDFLRELPNRVFNDSNYRFATPSEVADGLESVDAIDVPYPISWADEERDLT